MQSVDTNVPSVDGLRMPDGLPARLTGPLTELDGESSGPLQIQLYTSDVQALEDALAAFKGKFHDFFTSLLLCFSASLSVSSTSLAYT